MSLSNPPFSQIAPAAPRSHDGWLIFCAAIDNFGDIGVCWRLARQLVSEHGQAVVLYVDDWDKALAFVHRQEAHWQVQIDVQGVQLCRWHEGIDWSRAVAGAGMVIEAFGCNLPDALIDAMAAASGAGRSPPGWLNLEYLSAEPWVEDYHRQKSLQSAPAGQAASAGATLSKTFFFPGFTTATGGLLREAGLLASHQTWQAEQTRTRAGLLLVLAGGQDKLPLVEYGHALWISLFAYPRPPGNVALRTWFAAMADGADPVLCLVPAGSVLVDIADALDQSQTLVVGDVISRGALTVAAVPFLPPDDYDRLLSVCDLNLVRGEDSFVRAQWAAKPLIWHIYPQQDDAHQVKLDAFLTRYGEDRWSPASADKLARFTRFWNLDADCRKLWHDLRPQLPDLTHRARNWQQKLAALPDLASSLMQFYRNRP